MRVLQIIDSLEAGGAERMAVNIANALSLQENVSSFLCATRKEGMLKTSLNDTVGYLCLNKRSTLDIAAIKRLYQFIKNNNIEIVHAHSTSFFIATIVKLFNPNVKIVWHDHYGNSEFLEKRKSKILHVCSKYFSHVICVTDSLKDWAMTHLKTVKVSYLPNFVVKDSVKPSTVLKGVEGKRVLHLANLRPQKDHFTLIKAFNEVIKESPDYTLHCVGKDFENDYSAQVFKYVEALQLNTHVFFYGSQEDVSNILSQSDICVLSSKSEGLPIALLEYGLAGKPTIVTDVGNCTEVIEDKVNGLVVPKEHPEALAEAMLQIIGNADKAREYGKQLKHTVEENYSQAIFIKKLTAIYKEILNA